MYVAQKSDWTNKTMISAILASSVMLNLSLLITLQSPGPGQYSVDWPELSSSTRQPVRHPRQPVHHPPQPVHHPPQPVHHPPPKVATTAAIATGEQCQYAAKCSTFMERVEEDLDIADIRQELTRENYKEKFHKLLCWEEKEHIDILERRLEFFL